jgi:hypothetical protein
MVGGDDATEEEIGSGGKARGLVAGISQVVNAVSIRCQADAPRFGLLQAVSYKKAKVGGPMTYGNDSELDEADGVGAHCGFVALHPASNFICTAFLPEETVGALLEVLVYVQVHCM